MRASATTGARLLTPRSTAISSNALSSCLAALGQRFASMIPLTLSLNQAGIHLSVQNWMSFSAESIFRIARLFRLVRVLKGLNKLLLAFALSVPKLFNVGLVMVLLLYLYAVLGVSLFAKVAYTGVGIYGPQANFRTFFQAISLLIRSMTGEGWNYIMHDLSKSQWYYESLDPNDTVSRTMQLNGGLGVLDKTCREMDLDSMDFASLDLNQDGYVDEPTECGSQLAFIYFISYTILVSFVILNLFIAVIFEGFEESRGSEPMEVITKCLENWERYDPFNTMYIPLSKALDFIDETVEELMSAKQPQKGQCIPDRKRSHKKHAAEDQCRFQWPPTY
eukprot:g14197.t1